MGESDDEPAASVRRCDSTNSRQKSRVVGVAKVSTLRANLGDIPESLPIRSLPGLGGRADVDPQLTVLSNDPLVIDWSNFLPDEWLDEVRSAGIPCILDSSLRQSLQWMRLHAAEP